MQPVIVAHHSSLLVTDQSLLLVLTASPYKLLSTNYTLFIPQLFPSLIRGSDLGLEFKNDDPGVAQQLNLVSSVSKLHGAVSRSPVRSRLLSWSLFLNPT